MTRDDETGDVEPNDRADGGPADRGREGSGDDGHSHGGHVHHHGGAGATPEGWYERFKYWALEWLHGLYHGMVEHHAYEKIEKEAEDVEDVFLFACFADAFGIPSPVSYYTVELLPYLAEEFEQWERRMWDRETLLERKGQQYHFH
jgi:hypothetical protein